ncbi:hypothetical protein [Rhizobium halophytocola]|uniref:Holin n=1 Tax=Rhizobium halophytocola TaxID=735519 RepID=A0ABS4DYX7_9HYPH|nr:hypothetical protein [Rhizobium halophytocola]MBP1850896.1 hypothetical protein [Rhizobium halophytocola]
MDTTKTWYTSRTVWGGLIAVAAPLLQLGGLDLDQGLQGDLADTAVTLAGAVGGLLAIWGRLAATKSIG